MPKIRRSRKRPPDGWELIEPTLEELEQKMREGSYYNHYQVSLFSYKVLHQIDYFFCFLYFRCFSRDGSP